MKLEQILDALVDVHDTKLPIEGLEAAKQNWSSFYPELIKIMDAFIADPAKVNEEQRSILFYGTLLLAELKYTPALDKVMELFACQDTLLTPIEAVFGDALTEILPTLFYILADGNPEVLSGYILDSHPAMYAKGSAIDAVFAQYESGIISTEMLTDYVSLWRASFLASPGITNSFLLTVLAMSCIDYGLDGFKNDFVALCNKDVFDEEMASLDEIRAWNNTDSVKRIASGLVQADFNLVETFEFLGMTGGGQDSEEIDVQQEMTKLLAETDLFKSTLYDENYILENSVPVASLTKVGRNDPCPCGSGKKYKKCCLH
ncbi:DUF1186 domain-containing protein [Catenovulum maritimum]|uniref:SecC motif-containing protein n=1 Tax=Catenovulum maritimum TaxID=1513271 RepID=A0A0J8GWY8_9ALTE|nr:DUF1186 domain-containing protein [Catenovulum maritimum]KMT65789.1 SecC motif-containing protein [Catenovulum maritimum]